MVNKEALTQYILDHIASASPGTPLEKVFGADYAAGCAAGLAITLAVLLDGGFDGENASAETVKASADRLFTDAADQTVESVLASAGRDRSFDPNTAN